MLQNLKKDSIVKILIYLLITVLLIAAILIFPHHFKEDSPVILLSLLIMYIGHLIIYNCIINKKKLFPYFLLCLIPILGYSYFICIYFLDDTSFIAILVCSLISLIMYIIAYILTIFTINSPSHDDKISKYTVYSILTLIIINIAVFLTNYCGCHTEHLISLNFAMLLIAKMLIWDPLKEIDFCFKKIFTKKKIKNIIFGLLYIIMLCSLNYSLALIATFTGLLIILHTISYLEKKKPNLAKKKLTSKFSIFSIILYSLACLIIFYNMFNQEYTAIYKSEFDSRRFNQHKIILYMLIKNIPCLIIYLSTLFLLGKPLLPNKISEKKIMSSKAYLICFIILILTSIIFPPLKYNLYDFTLQDISVSPSEF